MVSLAVVDPAPARAEIPPFRAEADIRDDPLDASMCPICSMCTRREACVPGGHDRAAALLPAHSDARRARVGRSTTLFRAGDNFAMLYAIRQGSFKTTLLTRNGQEQIAGFHMPGEILGSDGAGDGHYGCAAMALEDSEVCAFAFDRLQRLAQFQASVRQTLHRTFAREIVREQKVMLMLGTMSAEQRVSAFLLDLSQRYLAQGYSSREFVLRLSRSEIGSYLGLKLETISRLLSRLHREGLIQVQGRVVQLLDLEALNRLVQGSV